jgi:hypothetical protein
VARRPTGCPGVRFAGRKIMRIVAALCVVAMAAGSEALAQARFRLLSVDTIDAVGSAHVYTIRDDKVGTCYVLFVLDPSGTGSVPPEPAAPTPTAEQLNKVRLAEALRELTAVRDRRMAEARRYIGTTWTIDYQMEQERIQEEYENAVRDWLPGLFPAAQIAPGWRTTGADELNDAVRRAIDAGDAAKAAVSRSALDDQLLRLLSRTNASAGLTVSGPAACAASAK